MSRTKTVVHWGKVIRTFLTSEALLAGNGVVLFSDGFEGQFTDSRKGFSMRLMHLEGHHLGIRGRMWGEVMEIKALCFRDELPEWWQKRLKSDSFIRNTLQETGFGLNIEFYDRAGGKLGEPKV